jgi:hypothetical protein
MANTTYQFNTITAAQAQTVVASDTIIFSAGPASAATVIYVPATGLVADQIVITYGGISVSFAVGVADAAQNGNLIFPDSSQLFIGTFNSDTNSSPVDDTFTITGWFVSPTGVGDLAVVSVVSGQGWAAGSSGAAFTRDGGESWQTRSLGPVTGLHAEGNAAYFSDGDGLARLDGSDGTPIGLTDSAVSLVAGRADLIVAAGGTRCVSTNSTSFACGYGFNRMERKNCNV